MLRNPRKMKNWKGVNDMARDKEKLITVVVPIEIYNKLTSVKQTKGVTIQFQINEMLKEKLCKS